MNTLPPETVPTPSLLATLRDVWHRRCPRCRMGSIYRGGNNIHDKCPVCEMLFERERGYYIGALYISYTLTTLFLGLGTFGGWLLFPDLDLCWTLLIVAGLFLPFVPSVTRYSRVLWIWIDRWIWPTRAGKTD